MSDEVKNGHQLRVGLIDEILSVRIFIRVIRVPWRFFHLAIIRLLCRDAEFPWNTLDELICVVSENSADMHLDLHLYLDILTHIVDQSSSSLVLL
jgi:hypothetical protein